MAERRYDDKEIAAIFRAATEGPRAPQREVARDEGLTLADLQAIGGEVASLQRPSRTPRRLWMCAVGQNREPCSACRSACGGR